jgi:cellulose synthase (UDP-forming)
VGVGEGIDPLITESTFPGAPPAPSAVPVWLRQVEDPRADTGSDSMLQAGQRIVYWLLVVFWLGANLLFWSWWLRPEHVATSWLYLLFTAALAYDGSFLPSIYLYYVGKMRRPRPVAAPSGLRVALITLCVPAKESLDVISQQLKALAAVRYPHDSWVLDEGNDPAVREIALRLGVRYFSRAGVQHYNQPSPPFQAKTKAGNVNAWLDAHGSSYEFFVQFDIDHRPVPSYLDRVLGYFQDPLVGWVQAPSLYGNLESWVARGAAEQELVLQGPLQSGFYGATKTPFIIGSHSTYRTRAIREIGGFQPTRAEDHLDTVVLASRGYRGVFVPETLAVGDGPTTFDTYLRQQFAWAYSMIQVLFHHTPRLVGRYRPTQAFQFLFAQTWYTFWSTSMLLMFLMPLITLVTGARPSTVDLRSFLLVSLPLNLGRLAMWQWTRRWQRPAGLNLSWRGIILHIARWPVVVWALVNVLLRVKHPYMITPKGSSTSVPPFPLLSQSLYLGLAWLSLGVVWLSFLGSTAVEAQGYALFALAGAFWMLAVVVTNLVADAGNLVRRGVGLGGVVRLRLTPVALVVFTVSVLGFTACARYAPIVDTVTWSNRGSTLAQTATIQSASGLTTGAPAIARNLPPPEAEVVMPPRSRSATPVPVGPATLDVRVTEGVSPLATVPTLALDLPADRVSVGAYDPSAAYATLPLSLEEWFVPEEQPDRLAVALAQARNRRTPIITIEPQASIGSSASLLQEITFGQRDPELRRLAEVVRQAQPQIVLLRWGHEMDLFGLYPWSVDNPPLYRSAFRHVVDVFREEGVANARWIWSSAGTSRAVEFYPGDDVVDYVGLTILGDPTWDASFGLPAQSFSDLLRSRYAVVQGIGKPIIIAELGVSGAIDRQKESMLGSTSVVRRECPLHRGKRGLGAEVRVKQAIMGKGVC